MQARQAEGRDASDADAAIVELQRRTRELLGPDEGLGRDPRVAVIDTDCTPDERRARLEAWLRVWVGSVLEDRAATVQDIDPTAERSV